MYLSYCVFLGWPKVKVLAKPVHEILPAILLALNSFILPIIISCAIYLRLISIKKKLFLNKINGVQNQISVNIVNQNNDTFLNKTQLYPLANLNPQFNQNCSNFNDISLGNNIEQNKPICIIAVGEVQDTEVVIQNKLR